VGGGHPVLEDGARATFIHPSATVTFVWRDGCDDCVVHNSCDHSEDEIDRCRCRKLDFNVSHTSAVDILDQLAPRERMPLPPGMSCMFVSCRRRVAEVDSATMRRVLLTGISGVGKSTVVAELAALGYKTVDTDYGWCHTAPDREWLWRGDLIEGLLSTEDADVPFIAGAASAQVSSIDAPRHRPAQRTGRCDRRTVRGANQQPVLARPRRSSLACSTISTLSSRCCVTLPADHEAITPG
jgi:hypothetical protein